MHEHKALSRYININGFVTHYLEAGSPSAPTLVLIHSCEYSSCAELNWEYNIDELAEKFHVLAPDLYGYGKSEKIYDFGRGPALIRHRQLKDFLKALCVEEADFIGNSCGGAFPLLWLMGQPNPKEILPLRKLISISPPLGPYGPGRDIIGNYDGTRESIRVILKALFHSEWFPRTRRI